MKKLVQILVVILFCINHSMGQTDELPSWISVVPKPISIQLFTGDGLKSDQLVVVIMEEKINRPVMGNILSQLPENLEVEKGELILQLVQNESLPKSEEGYQLKIEDGNVTISARGNAGLFYGCQTLEQMLEDARDNNAEIPACIIIDYPALSYRAVHFDVKHHLDHMNYYYESIDRLAKYKINAIIFEFEDKLRYKRQPLVGAPQAISIDEMAALTQYAKERYIEISPLVQGLGHATFILKNEHYNELRELSHNRWAFCPKDERTYEVLFDLYRDAIDATPGAKYLHIGGDEIGNIGLCERCNPGGKLKNASAELNKYWLVRVSEFAVANNRIPIFWDDMVLKGAGVYESTREMEISEEELSAIWEEGSKKLKKVVKDFPKESVFMRWNYTMGTQPGNLRSLEWYEENNLDVIIATAANSGAASLFPFDNRNGNSSSRGIAAIKNFIQIAEKTNVVGMLSTAWDDRSPHMETYWRGFIASAEYSWSPNGRTIEEYDVAYLKREFGTSIPNYINFYTKLRDAANYWDIAYMREGNRMDLENTLFELPGVAHWMPPKDPNAPIRTDFRDILMDLPDFNDSGKWSEKYSDRLTKAVSILEKYEETSKIIEKFKNSSKSNRYHWELYAALNDFQISAPYLMLAIKRYDTSDIDEHEAGKDDIKKAIKYFQKSWKNLKDVYGKTRFITQPSNFVPDRYFHFASQREDLTWMIQVEELLFEEINRRLLKNN